jgi:hypothetical protein
VRGLLTHRSAVPLALVLLAGAAAACGAGGGGADTPQFAPPPLASTFAGAAGAAWVSVPMGPDGLTTYELFVFVARAETWALVTPPGVATTGGLVLAGRDDELDVAFVTAEELAFSPLAATGDDGKVWTTGTLSGPVTAAPDALASVANGELLALVPGAAGGLEAARGDLSAWRAAATAGDIDGSAGGRACDVRSLTAVAAGPAGSTLVGASCEQAGVVGVLQAGAGGSWQLAGPELPAGSPRGNVEVLRLMASGGRDVALLGIAASSSDAVVAAWLRDGSWTSSVPLPLRTGEALVATGTTSGGGCYVLLSQGSARRLLVVSPTGPSPAAWRVLATPPPGTAAAAFLADGRVDALVVDGSNLTVDELAAGASHWVARQTIAVPIPTGSSS